MITTAELKQYVKLDPNDDRVKAQSVIDSVVDMFESMTRRLWVYREAYAQTTRVDDHDLYFWLDLFPVMSLSLTEWSPRSGQSSAVVIDADDYYLKAATGRVERLRHGRWLGFIQATITGGYTPTTAPPRIKQALIAQVSFVMKRLSQNTIDVSSLAFEKGSTTMLTPDLHPLFREVADQESRSF
jgi:hypothetical protein